MNFDNLLKIGDTNINEYIVKTETTAYFFGNEGVTVLSTPSMIGFMEATVAQIVTRQVPENYRPVGTKFKIEHVKSTSVNEKVTIKATLIGIEGKKLRFDVEAFNERHKITYN